jgi:small nuclear ribonucleoprotein (snRNP)-like protein
MVKIYIGWKYRVIMELTKYLNKNVQIILDNNFTYIGLVISADENSINLIDKNNSNVSLKETTIKFIKEII